MVNERGNGHAPSCRYFPRTVAVGARIHSDSWGSSYISYDADSESLDRFCHETPAFLSVFSAGNYGVLQSQYGTTVNAPALAKNTIAVGNAFNARMGGAGFQVPATPIHRVAFTVAAANGTRSTVNVRVAQALFSGPWGQFPEGAPVVLADPIDVRAELFRFCHPPWTCRALL